MNLNRSPRKANVVGKLGSGTGGLAYFGHTDVVPVASWFSDRFGPYKPTIKGDKLYGRGSCDIDAYRERADVDYVTGALCAFRADTWRRFGPMDASFFPAYFEEADFCVRARAAGMRVVYVPESEAVHAESSTLGRGSAAQLSVYHRNRMRFVARHLSRPGVRGRTFSSEMRWLFGARGIYQVRALAKAYPGLAGDLFRAWRGA